MAVLVSGCNTPLTGTASSYSTSSTLSLPNATTILPSPTFEPSLTPSLQRNETATATPSKQSPTATTQPAVTLIPKLIPISLPIYMTKRECITVEPTLPPGFLSDGIVILADLTPQSGSGELRSLSSEEALDLTLSRSPTFYFGEVSPAGEWLAYEHLLNNQLGDTLVIISSDGQVYSTTPWSDYWQYPPRWLDNDRVIFKYLEISSVTFQSSTHLHPRTRHSA